MELKDIKDSTVKVEDKKSLDESKKVGFWLGLGILFAPYIFGWITLRKGYSNTARLMSFSWLFLFIFVNISKHESNSNYSSSSSYDNSSNSRTYSSVSPKWRVSNYIDEFKQATKDKYVTLDDKITGTFSNSATTNSALLAKVLIEKKTIEIRLYEYAGETEASIYNPEDYKLKVLDKNGKKHSIDLSSGYKALVISGNAAKKLKQILKDGGDISFSIQNEGTGRSSYNFSISNAEGFQEAISKL